MITRTDTRPWYQQIWFWFVFGIPGLTIVAGIVTIVIAFTDTDGLVSDDYYKDGMAINQSLQRSALAKRLNLQADVRIQNGQVALVISSDPDIKLPPQLQLTLAHATRSNFDQVVTLLWDAKREHYVGSTETSFTNGAWYASVETDQWRIKKRLQPPFPEHFNIP